MEMKTKIIEKIKSDYSGWNDGIYKDAVLCVISLIENYDININDYETTEEFIEELQDNGYINEAIDGFVPIYNSDLYEWVKDNGHYVTDALNEYGYNDKTDFEQMLKVGYFYQLKQLVYEILYNEWVEEYKEGVLKE